MFGALEDEASKIAHGAGEAILPDQGDHGLFYLYEL